MKEEVVSSGKGIGGQRVLSLVEVKVGMCSGCIVGNKLRVLL